MCQDTPKGIQLRVQIDGIPDIGFAHVTLPVASAEVIEVRDGADPSRTKKIPGVVKFTNIVMKRGVTNSTHLFAWWTNIANGTFDPRDVSVIALDQGLVPVKHWKLSGVWPARYMVALDLEEGKVSLMETIECAVNNFETV
jgi:phage tail-like protein